MRLRDDHDAPDRPHPRARLIVVDDHPIVRHGIVQVLSHQPDLQCDLEAESVDEALELLRQHPVDLVVADISMPGLSGLDLVRRVAATWPTLPVLIVSMHDEAVYAERAFAAGARGYVAKQGATGKLLEAVRRLLAGGAYFSPALEQQLLQRLRGGAARAPAPGPLAALNDREFEVLQMLAQGRSSVEMAARINRSVKSIEAYRASLRQKLGARTLADLTRLAIEYCQR